MIITLKSVLNTFDCFDLMDCVCAEERPWTLDTLLHAGTKDYFLLHVNTNVQKTEAHSVSYST